MIVTGDKLINFSGKSFVGADSNMENKGTVMGEEKDNRKVDGSFLILNFIHSQEMRGKYIC